MRKNMVQFIASWCVLLGSWLPVIGQSQALMTERVYLQTDRELYWGGATVFVQVLVVDALLERPTAISQVAYVELWDENSALVARSPLQLRDGKGAGTLQIPENAPGGWLQLRAYTRWMMRDGKEAATIQALALVQPEESLPVRAVSAAPLRVRFFPEGGELLAGQTQRMGVQVWDAWGNGHALSGRISTRNDSQTVVVQTNEAGFGEVTFQPKAEVNYELQWEGQETRFPLPTVQASGLAFRLTEGEGRSFMGEFEAIGAEMKEIEVEWIKAGLRLDQQVLSLKPGESNSLRWKLAAYPNGPSEIRVRNQAGAVLARRIVPGTTKAPEAAMALLSAQSLSAGDSTDLQLRFQGGGGQVALSLSPAWLSRWVSEQWQGLPQDPDLAALCQSLSYDLPADTQLILPERYGRLLSGKVSDPQPGTTVILALTGEQPELQFAAPDEAGRFFFTLPARSGRQELAVIARNSNGSNARVQLDDWWLPPPAPVPFQLAFPEAEVAALRQEIRLAQAEQAYQQLQPIWRERPSPTNAPFYAQLDEEVHLDDFTRFATEETFRELIYAVKVRKKGQEFSLQIYDDQQKEDLTDPPLLLLDGLPVFSANDLLGINTKLIERVELLKTGYFLGQRFWGGMIHLLTYRKDGTGYPYQASLVRRPWEGVAPEVVWHPVAPEAGSVDLRSLWQWNWLEATEQGVLRQSFRAPDRLGEWSLRLMLLHPGGGVSFRELPLSTE